VTYDTVTKQVKVVFETPSDGMVTYDSANNQFKVKNEPGTELPKTGGQGTGIFGTLGGILILAGAYLLTKRKKQ